MIITLPMPPGINRTYKIGNKKFYKSDEAVQWQHDAFFLIKASRFQKRFWVSKVEIIMCGREHKKWDIDMGIKLILDTLVLAGIFKDDSEIDEVLLTKKFSENVPTIQISV